MKPLSYNQLKSMIEGWNSFLVKINHPYRLITGHESGYYVLYLAKPDQMQKNTVERVLRSGTRNEIEAFARIYHNALMNQFLNS